MNDNSVHNTMQRAAGSVRRDGSPSRGDLGQLSEQTKQLLPQFSISLCHAKNFLYYWQCRNIIWIESIVQGSFNMGAKNQSSAVLQAEEQHKITYVLDVIYNNFRYISNITELEKTTGVCSKESTRLFR